MTTPDSEFSIDRIELFGATGEYSLTSTAGNRVTHTFCPTFAAQPE